jgi:hypothetical protein
MIRLGAMARGRIAGGFGAAAMDLLPSGAKGVRKARPRSSPESSTWASATGSKRRPLPASASACSKASSNASFPETDRAAQQRHTLGLPHAAWGPGHGAVRARVDRCGNTPL